MLPLLAMCDRWDIGGLSTNWHPQTGGPTIFIYDGHPGGIGITRRGFDAFERLVGDAYRLVSECPCEDGLPVVRAVAEVRQPQRAARQGRLRQVDGVDAPDHACRSGSGSIGIEAFEARQPLSQISKCRCGPVDPPVLPTEAIR